MPHKIIGDQADFNLQVSMGRRPLITMVVYHMPTIIQPCTEMWPEEEEIPMKGEEVSDWVNTSSHSLQERPRPRLFVDVETQETQTHKRPKAHSVTPSKKQSLTEPDASTRGDKQLRAIWPLLAITTKG